MNSKILYLNVLALLLLGSCGTYRYHQPTPNPALFSNAGEVHASGNIGSSGASARGAFSLPNNIGVTGMYHAGISEYRSKEGELGIGYYSDANPRGIFIGGGLGFGSNFGYTDSTQTMKSYEGEFTRPYVQFNGGFNGGKIIGGLRGDLIFSLKANYLIYDGKHLDGSNDQIKSRYLFLDPAVVMGLGSKAFRFDFSVGYPFRPNFEPLNRRTNARVLPVTVGFGIRFVFGRKADES